MAIKATKIEIWGFGKASETRDNWKQLSIDCQRMLNRLWQVWLCHHSNNDSANKLRKHFEAFAKWKETKEGEKPAWPCKALEEPLTKSADENSFYRILRREFPGVNVRTQGLLLNAWQSKLSQRKAASGNLPGWVSILFANESMPSFTRPQPIPFDKENSKIKHEGDKIILELRIERLTESGKSVVEPCELILNKRKTASVRAIVERIIRGEYAFKGSNLVFDRGKWFASISYEMPQIKHPQLDENKTLVIRAGSKSPWRVKIDGGDSWRFCGNGVHIEYARRNILRERASRMQHNRYAGSNTKGHGRKRAESVWTKLSSRWKDFTKRCNHEVTRQLIRLAVQRGCGKIVYIQPRDSQRDNRYLSTAGNNEYSAMSWDYFQFGTLLANKANAEGIEYEAKKASIKTSSDSVPDVRKAGKKPAKRKASVVR